MRFILGLVGMRPWRLHGFLREERDVDECDELRVMDESRV